MFTILGASGFIGSHLRDKLRNENCYCPIKGDDILPVNLGHVIYCIGLTADFRTKPFETVDAHVCYLLKILKECNFNSFTYLSSTRVYGYRDAIAREDDMVTVEPLKFDDIYNISKIMGESICFAYNRDNVRVVRLSNVYGYDSKSENFIFTLIRDAINGKIILNSTLDSCKDHISIDDVVEILPQIAINGNHKLYNIASGRNTTVGEIAHKLIELTGCNVEVNKEARKICLPNISIDKIKQEFIFNPGNIIDSLGELVSEYRGR
jgi:nucleoside-diphosphate-sugar epimerase